MGGEVRLHRPHPADNVLGCAHDVWSVNTDRSYHESFTRGELETA